MGNSNIKAFIFGALVGAASVFFFYSKKKGNGKPAVVNDYSNQIKGIRQ